MRGGETTTEALERELQEEVGLRVSQIEPAFFKDGCYRKLLPNGELIPMYIIFLVFNCRAKAGTIFLNEEFSEYRWISPEDLNTLDLNQVTLDTLIKAVRHYRQSRETLP